MLSADKVDEWILLTIAYGSLGLVGIGIPFTMIYMAATDLHCESHVWGEPYLATEKYIPPISEANSLSPSQQVSYMRQNCTRTGKQMFWTTKCRTWTIPGSDFSMPRLFEAMKPIRTLTAWGDIIILCDKTHEQMDTPMMYQPDRWVYFAGSLNELMEKLKEAEDCRKSGLKRYKTDTRKNTAKIWIMAHRTYPHGLYEILKSQYKGVDLPNNWVLFCAG